VISADEWTGSITTTFGKFLSQEKVRVASSLHLRREWQIEQIVVRPGWKCYPSDRHRKTASKRCHLAKITNRRIMNSNDDARRIESASIDFAFWFWRVTKCVQILFTIPSEDKQTKSTDSHGYVGPYIARDCHCRDQKRTKSASIDFNGRVWIRPKRAKFVQDPWPMNPSILLHITQNQKQSNNKTTTAAST
jgi:hypothetical protein